MLFLLFFSINNLTKTNAISLNMSTLTWDLQLETCVQYILNVTVNNQRNVHWIFGKEQMNFKISRAAITVNLDRPVITNFFNSSADYVIYKSHLSDVGMFLKNLTSSSFWHKSEGPRSNFIVVTKEVSPKLYETFWSLDIMNVLVISLGNSEFEVFTANPFSELSFCTRKARPQNLGSCLNVKVNNLQRNIRRYSDCTLKVSVLNAFFTYPYLLKNDETIKDLNKYRTKDLPSLGFIVPLLIIIKEKLNVNFSFIYENYETQLANIQGNLTNSLLHRRFDTAIIMITKSQNVVERMDSTYIFIYDPEVWIVPQPTSINKIQLVVSAFDSVIWFLMLFTAITLISVLYFKAKFTKDFRLQRLSNCVLSVINATLVAQTYYWPMELLSEIMMVLYLLYTMNICYLYQAKLISILTMPGFARGIRNLEELLDSNLEIILHVHLYHVLMKYHSNELMEKVVNRSKTTDLNGILRLGMVANRTNIASVVMESYFDVNQELKSKVKTLSKQHLTPATLYFPMRRGHFLFEPINDLIIKILEAGFQNKWQSNIKEIKFSKQNNGFIALNLEHLGGAFYILGFGLVVGVVLFVWEIIFFLMRLHIVRNKNKKIIKT